ncbi:ABC transporter permease [Cohnella panacarvi]|uniref:ABC transporter permease n=1 Tax=Cohnella panacarvi TaxID=400776 RepID=UPI00047AE616|nr:ABC transporter permease subunit [Cohnella panacarvi]
MEQASTAATQPHVKVKKEKALNQGYWQKYGVFYLMMAPALIILLINNYLPMLGTLIAFKHITYESRSFFENFMNGEWVGMKNFDPLFKTSDAWRITRNTVGYNVVFIVLNLIIGVGFALMLNLMRSKFQAKIHQTVMFLPFFLSWVILAYLVYGFLSPLGVLNKTIFPAFGIETITFYQDTKWWPLILPLINTWKGIAYYAVIYLAAIIGIDKEYYEAATIDGASRSRQVWSITLPLIRPVIIVMTMLQIGRIFFSDFGLFYNITRNSGSIYETTQVIDTYVYQGFLVSGNIGLSSAAGFYQAVVGFVLVLLSNFVVRRISKDDALF